MSVRTTADEKLDEVRNHITAALKAMDEVVIQRCWGWDDFNDEARARHRQLFRDLADMRMRIDGE